MVTRPFLIALLFSCVAVCAFAQQRMSLPEAGAREKTTLAPAHLGQKVIVQGVVPAPAVHLYGYSLIVIQDDSGAGLTLEGTPTEFDDVPPGQSLEATGVIGHRAGLPVLRSAELRKLGIAPVPAPQKGTVADARKFENLGRYVTVSGRVQNSLENPEGDELVVGTPETTISVFLPRISRGSSKGFENIRMEDEVQVTGYSVQYCLEEPYDCNFEILVGSAGAVRIKTRTWRITPYWLAAVVCALLLSAGMWWRRERAMSEQRRILRRMTRLSEQIIAAPSPYEIARMIESTLPGLLEGCSSDLFIQTRTGEGLERVTTGEAQQHTVVNVNAPVGTFPSAVALCYRNGALLHVPDAARSPLFHDAPPAESARAVTLIPLLDQNATLGVLAVQFWDGVRNLPADQLSALQHLGNQIAASLRLQEQQSIREQLLRSERMAASGQLIARVANDLRGPLVHISDSLEQMLERTPNPEIAAELRAIAGEAKRGADLVKHLMSFSSSETSEPQPVELHALLSNIVELRAREWALKGMASTSAIPALPVYVLADQSQVERAFLNLVVQAEQALANEREKRIGVTSRVIGSRVHVGIDVSCTGSRVSAILADSSEDGFSWKVSQTLIEAHGGELRLLRVNPGYRVEISLPVHQSKPVAGEGEVDAERRPAKILSAVVVEPDLTAQRRLLLLLTMRGHRVVPVQTADQAVDMVQRMRFDLIFVSMRISGLNWAELFQRVRRRAGCFVLLTDVYDADSARTVRAADGDLLAKPIDEQELDALLERFRTAQVRPGESGPRRG